MKILLETRCEPSLADSGCTGKCRSVNFIRSFIDGIGRDASLDRVTMGII
jgi:hypothetical protein